MFVVSKDGIAVNELEALSVASVLPVIYTEISYRSAAVSTLSLISPAMAALLGEAPEGTYSGAEATDRDDVRPSAKLKSNENVMNKLQALGLTAPQKEIRKAERGITELDSEDERKDKRKKSTHGAGGSWD
ncbi:hypothetical protein JTB14_011722 [Gonioctena quinquepunctata]|nr:hypothetical protein JTB14_011722 [Gonioctena quinquepunctata]